MTSPKNKYDPMKNLYVLLYTILIASFTGCRDQVNEQFEPLDPSPVVNGLLIQDRVIKIHLSKTRGLDNQDLELVSTATVSLLVDDVWVENLNYQYEGYYKGQTIVESGHKYTCQVEIEGYETLVCEDSIPYPVQIETIRQINEATINNEGRKIPALEFSFKNISLQEQFFQFVIHLQVNPGAKNEYWRTGYIEETIDPVLLAEGLELSVFSNDRIIEDTYSMHVNYNTGSYSWKGDSGYTNLYPAILELRSISENYYQYLTQLKLYEQGRFPEFGAISYGVYPLHSNIDQGYGIFAGYSTVFSDTIFPY